MGTVRKPRLCMDIYSSNANEFLGQLQTKLAKLQSVQSSAQNGGDFEHTVSRNAGMIYSALLAARAYHENSLNQDVESETRNAKEGK